MHRTACLLFCVAFPLVAQSPFRATRHAGLPPIYVGDKFASGDLDGDGDIDLFVANDNSPNQLLLNDGYGKFVDATAGRFVNVSPNASHNVNLADIDGDGDLDILIGNDDFLSNRVYRNNGAGVFADVTATALPPNAHFTECQYVADFDGDGDVDWFTVDHGSCHLYENNGIGVFSDMSATWMQGMPAIQGERFDVAPRAADFDRDGDLDVLVPTGFVPFLILNQGGVFAPAPVQMPAVASGYGVAIADFDGDQAPDLFVGSTGKLLHNQGNGTFVDVTATAFASSAAVGIAVVDLEGDGDLDIVTATRVLHNNGGGVFAAVLGATSLPQGYNRGVAAADFDGDGDIDLPGLPNFLRQTYAPTAPMRGANYGVEFHAQAGAVVGACVALGAGPMPAGPFGTLLLDPGTAVLMSVAPIGTSPLALSWALPNLPGLAGIHLHYQACVLDPSGVPRITNAIHDVVQ